LEKVARILVSCNLLLIYSDGVVCRVDLCNQANDNEEEDDDEVDPEYAQLPSSPNSPEPGASKPHRTCFYLPFRRWRVRGRQRGVIAVSCQT
jgi:hypothetical protein